MPKNITIIFHGKKPIKNLMVNDFVGVENWEPFYGRKTQSGGWLDKEPDNDLKINYGCVSIFIFIWVGQNLRNIILLADGN